MADGKVLKWVKEYSKYPCYIILISLSDNFIKLIYLIVNCIFPRARENVFMTNILLLTKINLYSYCIFGLGDIGSAYFIVVLLNCVYFWFLFIVYFYLLIKWFNFYARKQSFPTRSNLNLFRFQSSNKNAGCQQK